MAAARAALAEHGSLVAAVRPSGADVVHFDDDCHVRKRIDRDRTITHPRQLPLGARVCAVCADDQAEIEQRDTPLHQRLAEATAEEVLGTVDHGGGKAGD